MVFMCLEGSTPQDMLNFILHKISPKIQSNFNYPRIKLELQLCLIEIWNMEEKRENHEKITLLTNFLFPLQ